MAKLLFPSVVREHCRAKDLGSLLQYVIGRMAHFPIERITAVATTRGDQSITQQACRSNGSRDLRALGGSLRTVGVRSQQRMYFMTGNVHYCGSS